VVDGDSDPLHLPIIPTCSYATANGRRRVDQYTPHVTASKGRVGVLVLDLKASVATFPVLVVFLILSDAKASH